jgi:hypothetical protein
MTQLLVLLLSVLVPIALIAAVLIWLANAKARSAESPRGDPPGIRTQVTFIGAERYMGADESFDELVGCGVGLLEKLGEGLRERRLETVDIIAENWGATLDVVVGTCRVDISVGYRGDDWLIAVGPARGSRGRLEDDELRRVLQSVHEALKELEGIERVLWHRSEDMKERGSPEPFDAEDDDTV